MKKQKRRPAKKCRQVGFLDDCIRCGHWFVFGAHVTPRCGGGYGDHKDHHEDDCCGVGNHKEIRTGLVCSECVFKKNMGR